MCARPHLGKYLNCVAIDDENWLICGGGPKLALVTWVQRFENSLWKYINKWNKKKIVAFTIDEADELARVWRWVVCTKCMQNTQKSSKDENNP